MRSGGQRSSTKRSVPGYAPPFRIGMSFLDQRSVCIQLLFRLSLDTRPLFPLSSRVMNRRDFVATAVMAAATTALPRLAETQDADLQPIWSQIEKLHDESV